MEKKNGKKIIKEIEGELASHGIIYSPKNNNEIQEAVDEFNKFEKKRKDANISEDFVKEACKNGEFMMLSGKMCSLFEKKYGLNGNICWM